MESLTLLGPFDFPAAIGLQARLARLPATEVVQIDFSHVTRLSSVALAGLAAWLSKRGHRVLAVGLQEPERRLLQFLGFGAVFKGPSAEVAAA